MQLVTDSSRDSSCDAHTSSQTSFSDDWHLVSMIPFQPGSLRDCFQPFKSSGFHYNVNGVLNLLEEIPRSARWLTGVKHLPGKKACWPRKFSPWNSQSLKFLHGPGVQNPNKSDVSRGDLRNSQFWVSSRWGHQGRNLKRLDTSTVKSRERAHACMPTAQLALCNLV